MSYLLRGLAANGGIRVIAADTTTISEEIRNRHNMSATATAAVGRSLTAGILLSHILLKNHRDRLSLRFKGDGPIGGVIVDAGLDGNIRAYAKNPDIELPLREDGKLNVGAAIGQGELEIIRSHAPKGDEYSSSVEIVTGEVAEDIAMFLAQSEQIASAVLLGVRFEAGQVKTSAGIILQAMPDVDPAALDLLEANVKAFGQLTNNLEQKSLLECINDLSWGMDFQLLTEDALPLQFKCNCSEQKAIDALAYFSPEERQEIIEQDGGAEVVCHWCNSKRWINPEQINSISSNEIRCPDCQTLWYRQGQATQIRADELCSCGRKVELPN